MFVRVIPSIKYSHIQKQRMFHFWLVILKPNSQEQNIHQTFTIYSPSLPFTSLRKRRRGKVAKVRNLSINQKEKPIVLKRSFRYCLNFHPLTRQHSQQIPSTYLHQTEREDYCSHSISFAPGQCLD